MLGRCYYYAIGFVGNLIVELGGRNRSLLEFSSLLKDTVRRITRCFHSRNTVGFIGDFTHDLRALKFRLCSRE